MDRLWRAEDRPQLSARVAWSGVGISAWLNVLTVSKRNFERLGFGEFSNFVQSDIEIVDARPVEEVALGVSLSP